MQVSFDCLKNNSRGGIGIEVVLYHKSSDKDVRSRGPGKSLHGVIRGIDENRLSLMLCNTGASYCFDIQRDDIYCIKGY